MLLSDAPAYWKIWCAIERERFRCSFSQTVHGGCRPISSRLPPCELQRVRPYAIRVGRVVAIAVRIVFLDVVEPAFSILSPRAQELGDFEWIVVSAESRVLRRFHLLRVVAIIVRRVGRVSPHVCLRSWSPEGLIRLVVRVVLLEITVFVCKSWCWSLCMTVV
jgi:hypothetical protein